MLNSSDQYESKTGYIDKMTNSTPSLAVPDDYLPFTPKKPVEYRPFPEDEYLPMAAAAPSMSAAEYLSMSAVDDPEYLSMAKQQPDPGT